MRSNTQHNILNKTIPHHRPTVLIAGHDELITHVVSFELKRALQVNVLTVNNGQELLNLIESREIDLIITELYLDYKNAFEVLDEIRNKNELDIPVLICSQNLTDESIDEAIRFGADDFIDKPIRIKNLVLRISILLKKVKYDD